MSVINTNITAMIGQQNLGKSQSALQTSMERLSSGLRINSAADDAAGQAIANRMSAQTTGLAQAQRNANDGISVAQTAEGALNQVNDNLQRIRELTVQAQNDTNSQSDLNSIQDEINQRLEEVDRISKETNFNGVKVLAEDNQFSIQVGANDGEKITMNLKEINAKTLGLDTFNVNKSLASAATAGDTLEIGGTSYTITTGTSGATGADSTDVNIGSISAGATAGTPVASGTNSLVMGEDGAAYVKNVSGSTTSYYKADLTVTAGTTSSSAAVSYTVAADAEAQTHITEDSTETATSNPLAALDGALSDVDSLRSELGAMQNRFDSAISNLSTTETNLSAARSRIEDADYAVEVSNMTRAQILQQAGTSVLAQANQVPQGVLSLLG
ncbi:MAG: FliC/FljB family flagellin [Alcanivorax sp.]|uniref:FliC/FljB family flagellin n=1 Tax=Alloalcanivorax marinus TaxID=1177169 RepID=UPI0019591B09|nr:FliC/FljB family flagellin [Alloalcanivorax marinus]MBM7333809.1 FliC/FljB family flagellin [Alloalcanivorax marinus]